MTDAVTVDTTGNNPAQDGPAIPNVDRQAPPEGTKTPEQIAAEAAAKGGTETPPAETPPADTPKIGDEPVRQEPIGTTVAEDGTVAYEATGYPGLDMALDFVGKLGIGLDHPAMQATKSGDFSLLEAHLATLGDKATGYDKHIALAKEALAQHESKLEARNTEITKAVTGVLGDDHQTIFAWAGENADPAERDAINSMLAAGPVQARAAANMLLQAYQAASGTVVKPASATTGTPGNGPAPNQSANGPLTNREFATESAKLHRQYGNAYVNTPQYRALAARLR